ncbi:MAG: cell division protein FtsL [Shimia sp.]
MRLLLLLLAGVGVIGLAFWAYAENYRTQAALSDVKRLHRQLAAAHAREGVLRAEWAHLNRPDRLRDLAEMNFETLGLLPMRPDQFADVDQIAFPAPPASWDLTGAVPVQGRVAP